MENKSEAVLKKKYNKTFRDIEVHINPTANQIKKIGYGSL